MALSLPLAGLSSWLLIPAAGAVVLCFLVAVGMGLQAQRRRHSTGLESLAGAEAEVLQDDGVVTGGYGSRILLQGEIWAARSTQPLTRGVRVRVTGRDGRVLLVEPGSSAQSRTPAVPATRT